MDRLQELFSKGWEVVREQPTAQVALVLGVLVYTLAFCRVFAKAGFHALLGLLMLVPGLNAVGLLFLAFGPWPVRRELHGYRDVERTVQRTQNRLLRHRRAA